MPEGQYRWQKTTLLNGPEGELMEMAVARHSREGIQPDHVFLVAAIERA